MARPRPERHELKRPSVSVIIPARNEAGNIADIFARTPHMGEWTELVFVEGHSKGQYLCLPSRQQIVAHPERRCQLMRQTGVGKGDAVRLGFARADGDMLMILDADLTVPPEDLPRFYEALCSGKGEFINGVRLVYPMEKQAMRFLNLLGNKFFSLAFSWLLGQPIKDTLCGTKVLWKKDYDAIAANRAYFGDFDPFGDFDLIFGAVKLNLKITDLPIRYRERTYGTTNIQRWKHGWLLLKMVIFAARRIQICVERRVMFKAWLTHPLTRGLDIDDRALRTFAGRLFKKRASYGRFTRNGIERSSRPCHLVTEPCWN